MPLTPEQKTNLLIGGGVGALSILGVLFLGRRTADTSPRAFGGPPLTQAPGHQAPGHYAPSRGQVRPERRRKRRRGDGERGDRERGERGNRGEHMSSADNGRGEYRKKKHKRHHRGD